MEGVAQPAGCAFESYGDTFMIGYIPDDEECVLWWCGWCFMDFL